MTRNRTLTLIWITLLLTAASVVAQITYPNLKLAGEAIDKEDWDSAITYLNKAIEADEAKGNAILAAGAYAYRCQAYFNKDKFELAVSDCNKSIEVIADKASVYHLRAASLSRLGKHDRAIADYTYAIQLEPKEGGHYFSRGISYSRSGNSDQAIADFGKALELDPNDVDALFMRAMEFRRKGDFDQALFDYQAVTKLAPRMVEAHIGLGLSYRHKKDFERAIASYNRALEINPRSKDALLFRGVAYADQAEYDLALRDYNEALRIDPAFVSPYAIRAGTLVKKGDYKGAVADFTRGLELGAGNAALYSRMWASLYANDGKAASADAQKLLQTDLSENQRPYVLIAGYLGLRKQNKVAEASAFLRVALKQPNDISWPTQVMRFLLGDLSEKQLTQLATDNDKATEARAYIGMMKILTGDSASAKLHFEWVKASGNKTFAEYDLALAELSRMPRAGQ